MEWVPDRLMHSSKGSEICCYHSRVDSQISTNKSRPFVKPGVWSLPELPVLNRPQYTLCQDGFVCGNGTERQRSYRNVSSLTARICKIEAKATSVSSGSRSAICWNLLGQHDGSTATGSLGSHGPGSSDDNKNTRRRLETFSSPDDENARKAVLPRSPCEQHHTGVSTWLEKFWATTNAPAFNKHSRIHCKTGALSASLVFETRAKCQDFVARYKDDGIPYEVHGPFCNTNTKIMVRQSKSLEDREIGGRCALLWKVLSTKLQEFFPERDAEDTFNVPALDVRSQIPSIFFGPQERGGKKQFSNLHHPDTNNCLILPLLACANLAFLMMYYDKLFVKSTGRLGIVRPMCDGRPSPPRRFAAWRVEAPLVAFSLCGGLSNLRPVWLDA